MSTYETTKAELAEKLRVIESERITATNVAREVIGRAATVAAAARAEAEAAYAAAAAAREAAIAELAIAELGPMVAAYADAPTRPQLRALAARWAELETVSLDQLGTHPSHKLLAVAIATVHGRLPATYNVHSTMSGGCFTVGDQAAKAVKALKRGDLSAAGDALDDLAFEVSSSHALTLVPPELLARLRACVTDGSFRAPPVLPPAVAVVEPDDPNVAAAPEPSPEPEHDDDAADDDAADDEPSEEREAVAFARSLRAP